jgi:hypothetical protein
MSEAAEIQEVRQWLVDFYEEYAPEKIGNVDMLLARHRGRENELIAKVASKYGMGKTEENRQQQPVQPPRPPPNQHPRYHHHQHNNPQQQQQQQQFQQQQQLQQQNFRQHPPVQYAADDDDDDSLWGITEDASPERNNPNNPYKYPRAQRSQSTYQQTRNNPQKKKSSALTAVFGTWDQFLHGDDVDLTAQPSEPNLADVWKCKPNQIGGQRDPLSPPQTSAQSPPKKPRHCGSPLRAVFRRADMGMVFNILNFSDGGIRVSKLKKEGDATSWGIQIGDEVTGLNDTPLHALLANPTDLMAFHQLMNADEMWIQSDSVGLVVNFNGSEQLGTEAPVAAYAAAVAAKASAYSALLWSRWAEKAASAVELKMEQRSRSRRSVATMPSALNISNNVWVGESGVGRQERRSSVQWELQEDSGGGYSGGGDGGVDERGVNEPREIQAGGIATMHAGQQGALASHAAQVFEKLMDKGFEVSRIDAGTFPVQVHTGVLYLEEGRARLVCDCTSDDVGSSASAANNQRGADGSSSSSKRKSGGGLGRFLPGFGKSKKKPNNNQQQPQQHQQGGDNVVTLHVRDIVEMQCTVDHPLRIVIVHRGGDHGRIILELPTQQARDTVVSNFNELLPCWQKEADGGHHQHHHHQHQHQHQQHQHQYYVEEEAALGGVANEHQIRELELELARAERELQQQKHRQSVVQRKQVL